MWKRWRQQRVYICVILAVGRWQKQKDALLGMETCCVWVHIYTVLAAFGLAWARLHRERIWQACLLSSQNNCLRITRGKSRWRYLEMTLPGDSLNHVHIRLGCYFACICVCVCLVVWWSRLICCLHRRDSHMTLDTPHKHTLLNSSSVTWLNFSWELWSSIHDKTLQINWMCFANIKCGFRM